MSFAAYAKTIDSRIGIPRRMDQQYVSSLRALLVFSQVLARCLGLFAAATLATLALVYSCNLIGIPTFYWLFVALAGFVLFVSAFSESSTLFIPFVPFSQLESYGRARWANRGDLAEVGLIRKTDERTHPPKVAIARFGLRHEVALPVSRLLQHTIIFGPTGAGKTDSLILPIIRQWLSGVGSVVAVSAKQDVAELAGHFTHPKDVYILNLADATRSDRIDLFSPARHDQAYAQAIAAMMVRSNADSSSSASQFFDAASTALVKSLILFLTYKTHQVTIDDLYALLSRAGVKGSADSDEKDRVFETLDQIMLNSGIREIVEQFRIFSNVERETKWNIIISLSTRLEAFRATQDIRVILTPPDSREECAGVKLLDLAKLRKPGTAVFIVIDEAQAKSLQNVVPTIIGTIIMYLRQTATDVEQQTPCLCAIDEAGQYYIDQLLADITLGRSRQMAYVLGLQSYEQLVELYGATTASAIFECSLTKVFLPGLAGSTARKLSEALGNTTAVETSRTDARNDGFDGVKGREMKRELMTPEEARQMVPFSEMVIIHSNILPIKASFLPPASQTDVRRMPLNVFDVTHPDRRPVVSIETVLAGQVSQVSGLVVDERIQLHQNVEPDTRPALGEGFSDTALSSVGTQPSPGSSPNESTTLSGSSVDGVREHQAI